MFQKRAFAAFIVLMITGVFLITTVGSAMAEKKTFRAGDGMYNNLRADYYGWHRMLDLIEQRTNGNITFKRLGKNIIGNEPQRFEATQKGTLDFNSTWATITSMHSKAAGALILPFLFNLPEDIIWNITSAETRALLDVVEKEAGIKIITLGTYEPRSFFNNKKPIKTIEDAKGLRIRTMASKDEQYWVSLTGARPGPSTFPELYQMLKTGVFDGYDGNFTVHDSMKYYEVNKYASIMGYHYLVPVFAVSWKAWKSLTPEEQTIVTESGKQAVLENYAVMMRMIERSKQVALKNGNEINEVEDLEKWREVVMPAYDKKMKESPAAKTFVEAVWRYHKENPRWPTSIDQPVPKSKY